MRTRVVIQSRLSSSRLPGKALMTVAGMPLIELVARRASRTGFEVVVATSVEHYDDLIAQHLARVGIPVVRGPLDDVLARFVDATSDMAPSDTVVRLTGDNPVADADLVQELIDAMAVSGHVYGRVDIDQVPEGLGAEVFSVEVLRQAAATSTDPYDHEHVTPWIRRHCGELLFAPKANPGDPAAYRCTTDCLHDYDRIARLFSGEADPVAVSWADIVARLVAEVDGLGPRVRPLEGGRGFPETLVGSARVGRTGADRTGADRDMAVTRETFVDALDRGVSHVYCAAEDVSTVRVATLPALNKRLAHVVEVTLPGRGPADLEVELAVERAFADLGQRKLAGVVVADADADSPLWARLAAYRGTGEIDEVGVRVSGDDDLDELPAPVTLVAVSGDVDPLVVQELAGRGVILLRLAGRSAGAATVIEPADPAELRSLLDAAR
ncbi:MAG TPA: NTP transferase domain-containing protein [Arachnia sp.]|nr:NTP transferase domain-containing protein [Arachnia sp.]HMT85120.1 NTP transferase domain-containing protein [Arachnia sp.]